MSPKARVLLGAGGACLLLTAGCAQRPEAAGQTVSAEKAARSAGGKIYDKWCSDCHSTARGPGSMALQRKYGGNPPAVLEERTDLSPEYVSLVVRHGMSFMPSFRKTEISDTELALLGTYLAPSRDKPVGGSPK